MNQQINFNSVVGYQEIKEELYEIKDFLISQEKYYKVGARIPKGVMLSGEPGVGKTLLVKALVSETNVPFYSITGDDSLDEENIIVKIKEAFNKARQSIPSIIFIDEIDKIVGDEDKDFTNKKTLKQLLIEIDGFESNLGVLVIATTSLIESIDPALIRAGRFDRIIRVPLPNLEEREAIIRYYFKNKAIDETLDIKNFAETASGLTGAQLETIVNEALILSIRRNEEKVTQEILTEALERVSICSNKTISKISKIDKHFLAVHEAGHAIASIVLEKKCYVKTISLTQRGGGRGHITITMGENKIKTKTEMEKIICSGLAGMAAEKLFFKKTSNGVASDLNQARYYIVKMICSYGMYGVKYVKNNRVYAEPSEAAEAMIRVVYNRLFNKTYRLLKKHKNKIKLIVNKLLDKEIIYQEEIINILKLKEDGNYE